MPDQPLQPFHPPTALLANLPGGMTPGLITTWALYFVFALWLLFTIVAVYHWLKYSNASWIAFPAIAAHLFVSLALMSYALSGSAFFLTGFLP